MNATETVEVYFRGFGLGAPIRVTLESRDEPPPHDPDRLVLVVRVGARQEPREYGPTDDVAHGLTAAELIVAWIDPAARAELAALGFSVTHFMEVRQRERDAARRFLAQSGGPAASCHDQPVTTEH